jgi:purine-binding chemotaxis protein CheW
MGEFATAEKPKNLAVASQFLTFSLGQEEYGIELLKVQEIKGYSAITPIPNTPPHIKGVMNLRGAVIPIVDLRIRFGMEAIDYRAATASWPVTFCSLRVTCTWKSCAAELRSPPEFSRANL